MRFAAVASAVKAMVWESETDGNPSVDADESSRRRVDRTSQHLNYVTEACPSDLN
ncbi:MAG: hypothetical protein ABSD41_12455 [Candidatus Bathyarchaeia archaeon]